MNLHLRRRTLHFLISVDQLAWSIVTLGYGYPDETISSASYRYEYKGAWWAKIARPTIDFIFFWEKNHCMIAYQSEMLRTQAPSALGDRETFVAVYEEVRRKVSGRSNRT